MKKSKNDLSPQEKINIVKDGLLTFTEFHNMHTKIKASVEHVNSGFSWANPYKFIVPYWAYDPNYKHNVATGGSGYFIYYVAHELAHLLAHMRYGISTANHDEEFYECFMEICPEEYQHFELEYMPHAYQYGIK